MEYQKYSCYEFTVYPEDVGELLDGWVYVIFDPAYKPSAKTIIRESQEWFESEGEATLAAIGHISLLENGEG